MQHLCRGALHRTPSAHPSQRYLTLRAQLYVCVSVCVCARERACVYLLFSILTLLVSSCSSVGGLHGEAEPFPETEQPASSQDGINADAPLHVPAGVRHVLVSQVN